MKTYFRFNVLIIFLLALVPSTQLSAFNKAGRTSFQFTKIGIGSRQASLGEACVAVVRDANAVFWNPANISGIDRFETSFNYTRWLADLNYLSGVIGYRMNGIGIFAISIATLDYGAIDEALAVNPSGRNDTRTGDTFTGSDLMIGLAYAREFTDRFSLGINLKYLREKLFTYDADAFTFDVGTYYDTGYKGIRIAMSAQNFASRSVKWLDRSDRQEGYDIPLIYKVGIAANIIGFDKSFFDLGKPHLVQLSFDALSTNDYGERYHLGAEYIFNDFIAFRGGYRFNYAEGNFSAGFGLNGKFSGLRMRIDYAFVGYEYLTSPHRFTVSFLF